MPPLTLTKKTRRFLVIWISINLIALFVNFAGLNWKTSSWAEHGGDGAYYYQQTTTIYFLTSTDKRDFDDNKSQFWPFIKFIRTKPEYKSENGFSQNQRMVYFNGIFDKYDYTEFIVYVALPFLIIGLRKMWK